MDYRGKVVVLTGASSGIGYEAARAFARRGAIVVAVARREALLQKLIEECRAASPESSYIAGDLGDRAVAERVVDEAVRRHGRLDILVNNAAISKHKHTYHTSAEEADLVMRVNFMSCVWTTYAAIPPMLRQGGGFIVNVSSFAAKVSPPREGLYAASKAAMNAFSEGLWNDLAGSNIHVALVNPGPIDTEIWEKEDEPPAYNGPKYPPGIVVDAIFEVIEKRRYELTIPRHHPMLITARFLRLFLPGVLRFGMGKTEPVPPEILDQARQRAAQGKRLGDVG
ncbi:MAG TPA: SDR family NAD(P)-dependent oxidoreductase [Candidatus Dormibacteraeota bacterium]|nr:SDR family NAD(P)-dependent oxidoreductase [Candidatus Dormibacteraeota bacterium]